MTPVAADCDVRAAPCYWCGHTTLRWQRWWWCTICEAPRNLDGSSTGFYEDGEREAERDREHGELLRFENAADLTCWLQAED